MRHAVLSLGPRLLGVVLVLAGADRARAERPQPPRGFTALFNGKDLTDWHGMPHYDPYKLAAMSEADRSALSREMDRRRQEALDRGQRRACQRRQRRLFDDRQGLRRHRVAHRLQDGRPRPTAAFTFGRRRRCKSGTTPRKGANGTSAPIRGAAACGTTARRTGQRPARPGRQAVRRVEQLPHPDGRRARHRLSQRQARRRSTPAWKTSGTTKRRLPKAWPIQLQTHGGEIRWRNIYIREIPSIGG